jgi:CheY-like chemotaxis protein
VIVSVRDGGMGLDHADLARLFEPFYTTKATGTGMGLAISRSIVRSHGGTLWGVSNRDGGSTFRFKIPVRAGHAASSSPQTGKILVVDDNRGMRKSLTRLLRSCGYQVAVAPDGARAVALTDTFRPDALVVDMSLGDMTGLDLVKRLRSVPAYGPMVMIGLTAYDDDDLRDACIAAGFDGYLVKQTQISELPALLEQRRNVSTRGSGDRR